MNTLNKIKRVYNTICFLKPIQIFYQIKYRFRSEIKWDSSNDINFKDHIILKLTDDVISHPKLYVSDNEFMFLNIKHKFEYEIDWNFSDYGKLWTYNLNYFEFLNSNEIEINEAKYLIKDFIDKIKFSKDGLEPYTISLRGINWIKYLVKNNINDTIIDRNLYQQYIVLSNSIEYHILGNHLLENGVSLLFGAFYFNDNKFFNLSSKILIKELDEQFLNDGAHFELSPVYHKIMLLRLLDMYNLIINNNTNFDINILLEKIKFKIDKALSWLTLMTYKNGEVPCFNDSVKDISPTTEELINYATKFNLKFNYLKLDDSGYRKFHNDKFELLVDVGKVGPDYQPGHAHADTLNFELHYKNDPIFKEVGTSTYPMSDRRSYERSSKAHNVVVIDDENSSDVWSSFRVGKRANCKIIKNGEDSLIAIHDGYDSIVTREIQLYPDNILIKDMYGGNGNSIAYFHLSEDVDVKKINENILFLNKNLKIKFNTSKISIESYKLADGYNLIKESILIKVKFKNELLTKIEEIK